MDFPLWVVGRADGRWWLQSRESRRLAAITRVIFEAMPQVTVQTVSKVRVSGASGLGRGGLALIGLGFFWFAATWASSVGAHPCATSQRSGAPRRGCRAQVRSHSQERGDRVAHVTARKPHENTAFAVIRLSFGQPIVGEISAW